MRKYLLASHGYLAEGLKNSVELILGKNKNIDCLCAYVGNNNNIKEATAKILDSIEKEDELIIMTDILGGSVNNELASFTKDKRVQLISGMNMQLVIEIILGNEDEDIKNIINRAVESGKGGIVYYNNLLKDGAEEEF